MSEPTILTRETDRVGIITLNRPKVLNALSRALIQDLLHVLRLYDANPAIGAIVIAGNNKAFSGTSIFHERLRSLYTVLQRAPTSRSNAPSTLSALITPIILETSKTGSHPYTNR